MLRRLPELVLPSLWKDALQNLTEIRKGVGVAKRLGVQEPCHPCCSWDEPFGWDWSVRVLESFRCAASWRPPTSGRYAYCGRHRSQPRAERFRSAARKASNIRQVCPSQTSCLVPIFRRKDEGLMPTRLGAPILLTSSPTGRWACGCHPTVRCIPEMLAEGGGF